MFDVTKINWLTIHILQAIRTVCLIIIIIVIVSEELATYPHSAAGNNPSVHTDTVPELVMQGKEIMASLMVTAELVSGRREILF